VHAFYEAPEIANTPSIINLITSIADAKHTFSAFLDSKDKEDWESYKDAAMRLLAIPCAFLNAACSASYYILILFHGIQATQYLSKIAACLGLLLCSIESIVEGVNIKRQLKLKHCFINPIKELIQHEHEPQKWLPKLQKRLREHPESYPELIKRGVLEKIDALPKNIDYASKELIDLKALILSTVLESLYQKYYTLTQDKLNQIARDLEKKHYPLEQLDNETLFAIFEKKISVKKTKLTRRIRPWLVKEMDFKAISIIKELNSSCTISKLRGIELSKKLFQKIETQNIKKIMRHTLGLAALAVTIAGLILIMVGCPYLIPFLLINLGCIFALLRWAVGKGLLEQGGWTLDYKKLLPNCILKLFHLPHTIEHHPEVEDTEIDRLLRELAIKEIQLIKKKIEQDALARS
jgi:hypothetical protein